ncbi:phosphotransferase [Virgibacillus sp. 179-BFC.A HS]|uniref:Phosphotransferase n=1 Tax=Tigheibacillus jepli TaxID=3035914 RepID=A0ABU5CGI6_9BACI|nr:phosphotransferase [Virgibacillus sp. 179-BFC.A HS]MDY0405439.1 phosphotransferase [Virgibacillus sp. 179-BFC.A HS]
MTTDIEEVLRSYRLQPNQIIPITDRVYKIETNIGQYAMKKSRLNHETAPFWKQIYDQAYHLGLHAIVPVYLTGQKELLATAGDSFYYLQPWLEINDTPQDPVRVLQTLSQVHWKTRRDIKLDTARWKENFKHYLAYCRNCSEKLDHYMDIFESKRYMSPFELLACTQYRDAKQALSLVTDSLERMLELEEETINWQVSLCHGNLRTEHIHCERQVYFLNWEDAVYDHPVIDLSTYLRSAVLDYDTNIEAYLSGLFAYMDINELDRMQCDMLISYLLNPSDYIHLLRVYQQNDGRDNVIHHTKHLQRALRPLLFGIAAAKQIEQKSESDSSKAQDESLDPS